MNKLIEYAFKFVGTPYEWGGDSIFGVDCSGYIQLLLSSVGIDPPGDQNAHMLYRYFLAHGQPRNEVKAGALAFYGTTLKITHVGFCIDGFRMLEAAGGGSRTNTTADAVAQNAYVKMRPVHRRKDLIAVLMPKYPKGMDP